MEDADLPALVSHGTIIAKELKCIESPPGKYEQESLALIKNRDQVKDQSFFDFAFVHDGKPIYIPSQFNDQDHDILIEKTSDGRKYISGVCLKE